MGMSYLLDSVILIDHFNNISNATQFIETHCDEITLSVISRAEVLTGFDSIDFKNTKDLLDVFPTINISKSEADLAAKLRRKYNWKLPDALQAAIAQYHKLTLITRNTKDFKPNLHSFVEIPYHI